MPQLHSDFNLRLMQKRTKSKTKQTTNTKKHNLTNKTIKT